MVGYNKLFIISHRGNVSGPNLELENNIYQITNLVNKKIIVEIDIWGMCGNLLLGHDSGQEKIDKEYIEYNNNYLLVHCKNKEAVDLCKKIRNCHYFWHNEDDYTFTNKGILISHTNAEPINNSILMLPEKSKHKFIFNNLLGICTDYTYEYLNSDGGRRL